MAVIMSTLNPDIRDAPDIGRPVEAEERDKEDAGRDVAEFLLAFPCSNAFFCAFSSASRALAITRCHDIDNESENEDHTPKKYLFSCKRTHNKHTQNSINHEVPNWNTLTNLRHRFRKYSSSGL